VILLDANLLIYAYDETSEFHEEARGWVEGIFTEEDEVGLALVSVLAFLRIMTNPALFDPPISVAEAVEIVSEWLSRPNVGVVQPTSRHLGLVADLARSGKARGPMLTDVHLACLAIEHGATLCSSDRGFARFPGLRVEDPLSG
jgi:toxin-antitoxin system PIN domain toxin